MDPARRKATYEDLLAAPDHVVAEIKCSPDLAGWRRERMPSLPEGVAFEIAPDWVCEVLSPSTARLDRTSKRATYAREGVRHLWFVDPIERLLEIFRLEGAQYVVVGAYSDQALVRAEPFEAIELELGALWER